MRRAIARYTPSPHRSGKPPSRTPAIAKPNVDELIQLLQRLDNPIFRIAVFGLVSRGKSAVLNALVGEPLLQTGPLNGVTQWPRSIYWKPPLEDIRDPDFPLQVELIDTPGLDEVEGQNRAQMAQEIAEQVDLILFVVSGDITHTEYQALERLRQAEKPILLVFNKVDLYPEVDRSAILANLTHLWRQAKGKTPVTLTPDDIVLVAAEPAALPVRVEWLDGRVTEEWEAPPPDINDLKLTLLTLLKTDGLALIALNALRQASQTEYKLAQQTVAAYHTQAEQVIWQFAKYKAIAVALNPIAVFDLLGGFASDLIMIRALAKLYGLPMTGYEASKLWRAIMRSSGSLLLSEVGSGLILGFGKSAGALLSLVDSPSGLLAYTGAMAAQAGASGYGTYAVGLAAQRYLEQGCSWGPDGIRTVMQTIVHQTDPHSIRARLQQDLGL